MTTEDKTQEQSEETQGQTQGAGDDWKATAVKAAAAAAATGAAALAAKKAMSSRGSNGDKTNGSGSAGSGTKDVGSIVGAVLSGSWAAAQDALLPAAEEAAGAAGEYLAENGPEVIRERIVPRFIESFNKARG